MKKAIKCGVFGLFRGAACGGDLYRASAIYHGLFAF